MKVHVFRTQMAMSGGFCSYDVLVSVEELTQDRFHGLCYQVIRNGHHYATFTDATAPDDLLAMPIGWDRYAAFKLHQGLADQIAADLARKAFPEVPEVDSLSLWYQVGQLGHAMREVEI
jgi:hypothetical protein